MFAEEPPKNSPLLALENVVLTPHVGGSTHEAQEAVGVQIAQQVKEYLKHGVIQNAVNVPSVSAEEYAAMQPYIVLAERMGAFLAQVSEGSLEEISIRYSGHIAEWKTELIRNGGDQGNSQPGAGGESKPGERGDHRARSRIASAGIAQGKSFDRRGGQRALDFSEDVRAKSTW